jgi:hypothetical protein
MNRTSAVDVKIHAVFAPSIFAAACAAASDGAIADKTAPKSSGILSAAPLPLCIILKFLCRSSLLFFVVTTL